jgi:hypothetical protein
MDAEPGHAEWGRRTIIFGAPILYYAAGMVHPSGPVVGDDPTLFLALHLTQPVLIALIALALALLVRDVEGCAAAVARLLVLPFAIAYSVFDTFAGIAMGELVEQANSLPPQDKAAAALLIHATRHSDLARPLYLTASALWLAAVSAVVVALRHRSRPGLVLLLAGATAFAISHARPWGPLGMAAILAGVLLLELPLNNASFALRRTTHRRSVRRTSGGA